MATNRSHFIERHGLWTADQARQAEEVIARVEKDGIRNIRIGWGDQHGIVRGKTVTAGEFKSSLRSGKDFQLVTAIFDTTNHPIVPPFSAENALKIPELIGLPDGVLVPDPSTFRVLPWAQGYGLVSERCLLRQRRAVSAVHPPDPAQSVEEARVRRSRHDRRSRVRVLRFQTPRSEARAGIERLPAGASRGRHHLARLPVSHREPRRRNRRRLVVPAGEPGEARPSSGDAGGRMGPRPVRDNIRSDAGAGGRGRRTAVPVGGQAALPPQRLPCQLHGHAEGAECVSRAAGICISPSRPPAAKTLSSLRPEAGRCRIPA